jgi:cytochrome d ubiquinol oxidase subunit I
VHGLVRTADVASNVAAPMIAVTLALYVTLYLALVASYVAVLKYLAEKTEETLDDEARQRAAAAPGVASSPARGTGPA